MPEEDEEISTLALSEMAIEDKKILEIRNFSIDNDFLKVADIFSQDHYNAKADICHGCERFVVNLIDKQKHG